VLTTESGPADQARGIRPAGSGFERPADAKHLIEFTSRQRAIRGRDRAEHLGIQVDLIQRDHIVDTIIKLLTHRAHLRR
jgi:hypothetical protein